MKKIKIIAIFAVVTSLLLGIYFLNKKPEYSYYLVLGDYLSKNQTFNNDTVISFSEYYGNYLLDNKDVKEVNSAYVFNNMTSKKMLEIIENNAYKKDESDLKKLIKKSKYITISLGINDVVSQIRYDSLKDELIYDKETIKTKMEVFKHNYHEIIEEIKDINDNVKVSLVGCYTIYNDSEFSKLVSDAIKEVAIEEKTGFIYLLDMSDPYYFLENRLYLNENGQKEVSKRVISAIDNAYL